nr:MAG TPA: hypothetical protein [Caudoviricetes sp.]
MLTFQLDSGILRVQRGTHKNKTANTFDEF